MIPNHTPYLSVIIVSYNNPDVLMNTISTLFDKLKSADFEIIVVDNASAERNVELIKQKFGQVKLIENSSNRGFAAACNQGAQSSKGDYLLFVNSDIIFLGDPIPELLETFKIYNDVGIVGCKLLNQDGSVQRSYYSKPTLLKRFLDLSGLKKILIQYSTNDLREKYSEVDIIKGAFLLIQKDLFDELSGFDENYFMYVEDVDLSYRAQKMGKKNYIVNTDSIVHIGWHPISIHNSFAFYNGNIGLKYFYKKNKNPVSYIFFLFISVPLLYLYYLYFYNDPLLKKTLKKVLKYYLKNEKKL